MGNVSVELLVGDVFFPILIEVPLVHLGTGEQLWSRSGKLRTVSGLS